MPLEELLKLPERKDPALRKKELIQNFKKNVDKFYWNCHFQFRCYYRHKIVLDGVRKSKKREELFSDPHFLEELYQTLKAWIGQRKAKLVDPDNFHKIVRNSASEKRLDYLSQFKLNECTDEMWDKIKIELGDLFGKLKVMDYQKSQLVGVSKLLHFMLPDLVPPTDNEYTLKFFGGPRPSEVERFLEILDKFRDISKELNLTENDLKREWDTSIPKLIDNAIIGYVKSEMKKS